MRKYWRNLPPLAQVVIVLLGVPALLALLRVILEKYFSSTTVLLAMIAFMALMAILLKGKTRHSKPTGIPLESFGDQNIDSAANEGGLNCVRCKNALPFSPDKIPVDSATLLQPDAKVQCKACDEINVIKLVRGKLTVRCEASNDAQSDTLGISIFLTVIMASGTCLFAFVIYNPGQEDPVVRFLFRLAASILTFVFIVLTTIFFCQVLTHRRQTKNDQGRKLGSRRGIDH
jgi:hypothetical protein